MNSTTYTIPIISQSPHSPDPSSKTQRLVNNKRKKPSEATPISIVQKAAIPILEQRLPSPPRLEESSLPLILSPSPKSIGNGNDSPTSTESNKEFEQLLLQENVVFPSSPTKEIDSLPPAPILYISNPQVASILRKSLQVIKAIFPDFPAVQLDCTGDVMWGRDSRIFLPSCQYLIPAEIPYTDEELGSQLKNFIFEEDFFGNHYYGKGFSSTYRSAAISHAKKHGIPIRADSKSCIEGGNCHIFSTDRGELKAIIGVHSLWLTFIALETQGWYQSKEFLAFRAQYLKNKKDPDQDSIRIANNFNKNGIMLFPGFEMNLSRSNLKQIIPLVAFEIEARREASKNVIASELGIPSENIAYLRQREFHIDLDCFPGTDNVVFVHTEEEAVQTLKTIQKHVIEHDASCLESCIKGAKKSLKASKARINQNLSALRDLECNPIPIAGDFPNDGKTRINFMNGVRLQSLYLTNGTEDCPLKNMIKKTFELTVKKHCPKLNIIYIGDGISTMETLLSEQEGGFRCMTWMNGRHS